MRTIIGLEIRIEQNTASKAFCKCPADHFAKKPNTQVCPVCLGLPGALPFTNGQAVISTFKFGLALGCTVAEVSKFDRKHYFYPDLPKGYQTSQYDLPLCYDGLWTGDDGNQVGITRIHLEEDTGKLVHQTLAGKKVSLVDFNRSGVPLMELVTEPHFSTTDDAVTFAKEIQSIVRFLQIADADMEKGSLRLEANVSVAQDDFVGLPNYKVELKNINSFKFMEKALAAEILRQTELLAAGKTPIQETRGYNETTGKTFSQRSKEEAQDYRYFPEADLAPMLFSNEEIKKLEGSLPELPAAKRKRYKEEFGQSDENVSFLLSSPALSDYFEQAVVSGAKHSVGANTIADMLVNRKAMETYPEPAGLIKKLVQLTKKSYASYEEVESAVEKVIEEQEKAVADYKSGKVQVLGFLIGMVQKELKGKGEVKQIKSTLEKLFKN